MTEYDKNPTNLTLIKKKELDTSDTIKSDTNETKWNTKKSDRCDTIKATQFNTLKSIDWSIKEYDWSIVEIDWQKEAETMEKIYNEWIESYKNLQ